MPTFKLTKKYSIYPEYTDSGIEWLGKIPKGWSLEKLKNSFDFEKWKNAALFTQDYIGQEKNLGEYPVYSGQTENNGIMGRIKTYEYNLQDPAIFTTTVGAKAMTPLVLNGKFSLSQNCLLMVPRNENVYSQFFYYQLFWLFKSMKDEIPSHMQPSLRVSDLNKSRVIFIWVWEQKYIADYLDEKTALIDQIIEKKLRQIELLREKRTAVINQAVTKGLDPNVELVESGIEWIGKVPKGWKVSKLKHLSNIFGRIGFRGYTVEDIVGEDEGAISLSPSNIVENILITEDNTYISWGKYEESPEIKIFNGDILLVKTWSTIGKVAYCHENEKKMTINPQLVVLKNIKINNKYFYYFLTGQSFQDQMRAMIMGGSTPSLSQSKIGAYLVTYANIEDQEKIIIYLDKKLSSFDFAIQKVEKSIELLREFKSSLISHVVTGKIKI